MRISDWSSDVCSSDRVEVGVAAEVVVHPRAAFEQAGQDLVDVLDRVGVVHAVAVDGALRAGARPVPGLARGVAVAAEQPVLAVLAPGHKPQYRPGFGKDRKRVV